MKEKTALMHVCKLFNPEMKTLFDAILIHKQLDILKVDVDGWTALHWSSVNGHEQLVKKNYFEVFIKFFTHQHV